MASTRHRHPRTAVATAIVMILGIHAAGTAQAATCKDELDQFERRLHSSSLATSAPDSFQELLRQAEETAELRDEERCLQSVAELNEALPENYGLQSASPSPTSDDESNETEDTGEDTARPSAPTLVIAGGNERDQDPDQDPEESQR